MRGREGGSEEKDREWCETNQNKYCGGENNELFGESKRH